MAATMLFRSSCELEIRHERSLVLLRSLGQGVKTGAGCESCPAVGHGIARTFGSAISPAGRVSVRRELHQRLSERLS